MSDKVAVLDVDKQALTDKVVLLEVDNQALTVQVANLTWEVTESRDIIFEQAHNNELLNNQNAILWTHSQSTAQTNGAPTPLHG